MFDKPYYDQLITDILWSIDRYYGLSWRMIPEDKRNIYINAIKIAVNRFEQELGIESLEDVLTQEAKMVKDEKGVYWEVYREFRLNETNEEKAIKNEQFKQRLSALKPGYLQGKDLLFSLAYEIG